MQTEGWFTTFTSNLRLPLHKIPLLMWLWQCCHSIAQNNLLLAHQLPPPSWRWAWHHSSPAGSHWKQSSLTQPPRCPTGWASSPALSAGRTNLGKQKTMKIGKLPPGSHKQSVPHTNTLQHWKGNDVQKSVSVLGLNYVKERARHFWWKSTEKGFDSHRQNINYICSKRQNETALFSCFQRWS